MNLAQPNQTNHQFCELSIIVSLLAVHNYAPISRLPLAYLFIYLFIQNALNSQLSNFFCNKMLQ
jgi:hypothetical protein